jgi:co-chaperonin GroES (HSP10)
VNSSGITPLDHRVLIKQDDPETVTAGVIILPPSETDKQKYAMTNATVIAVGSLAWAEAKHDAERFGVDFNAPVPGSRIKVGKYAGTRYEGEDGAEYTIVNDEDVIGLLA